MVGWVSGVWDSSKKQGAPFSRNYRLGPTDPRGLSALLLCVHISKKLWGGCLTSTAPGPTRASTRSITPSFSATDREVVV